jgi:hypothetical protein
LKLNTFCQKRHVTKNIGFNRKIATTTREPTPGLRKRLRTHKVYIVFIAKVKKQQPLNGHLSHKTIWKNHGLYQHKSYNNNKHDLPALRFPGEKTRCRRLQKKHVINVWVFIWFRAHPKSGARSGSPTIIFI